MTTSSTKPAGSKSGRSGLPMRILITTYSIILILSTWIAAFIGTQPAAATEHSAASASESPLLTCRRILCVCSLRSCPSRSSGTRNILTHLLWRS